MLSIHSNVSSWTPTASWNKICLLYDSYPSNVTAKIKLLLNIYVRWNIEMLHSKTNEKSHEHLNLVKEWDEDES